MAATHASEELYQDIILDHNRSPRNFREPDENGGDYDRMGDGDNPLCGDTYRVYLKVADDGETIDDVFFHGTGCAISKASASVMTQTVKGLTLQEARDRIARLKELVNGPPTAELDLEELFLDVGDMGVFAGLRKYPTRVKCGTLAWNTLKAAIEDRDVTVTTE